MIPAPPPGPGWQLLTPGVLLVRGDQFWSSLKRKWVPTQDVGQISRATLTYRRKTDAKAASTKVDLGDALATLAKARAKALQMTLTAYVQQCVRGELSRSNVAKIQAQAPTATPPVSHWNGGNDR